MRSHATSIIASAGATARPLVDWARSGIVALTGHADGPGLVPPGRAATIAARLGDRIAEATGGRVRIDGARLLGERAALVGLTRRGRVSAGGAGRLLPTADGWAAVSCARPDDPLLLGALIGADLSDLDADPWPAIAAWLREHPGAELASRAELIGVAAAPIRATPGSPLPVVPSGSARPVDGLLVVDFSALWAGPLCAQLLGMAGARVVKVETPQRPDGSRRGNPDFYRLLHAGHRSVVLDPTDPAGRRALAALAAAADIVIEASRPRALAGFGLDAHAAVAAGAIWVSITAGGRASGRIGFGDDIAASAGLVAYDDHGAPVFCGDAIADPLAGLTAAALALTAPAGTLLDIGMAQVVAGTLDAGVPEPAIAARAEHGGWVVDTEDGRAPVEDPGGRAPVGPEPAFGADTDAVLRELGIPAP